MSILRSAIRFGRNGRPVLPAAERVTKFRSKWAYYRDGHLHVECAGPLKAYCPTCRSHGHKRHPAPWCNLCREAARDKPYWYQSKGEAQVAKLLDEQLKSRKIIGWRRARSVVLQPGYMRMRPITYKPDFVVTLPDGRMEAWEVKSLATLTQQSILRIKMYRFNAARNRWPYLRVVDKFGRTMKA